MLSLLLSLSFKRVTCLLYSYLRDKTAQGEVESMIEANASLNEILLKTESQQGSKLVASSSKDVQDVESESPNARGVAKSRAGGNSVNVTAKAKLSGKTKTMTTAAAARKRVNQKVVDRRRRRGQRLYSGSSDSEGEEGEGRIGDSSLSDSSLSMPSDGESSEDIQVLESLSDSSGSEDERLQPPPQQRNSSSLSVTSQDNCQSSRQGTSNTPTDSTGSNPVMDSGKPRASGRRQIVLAASFNLVPSSSSDPSLADDGNHKTNRVSTDTHSHAQAQAEAMGDTGGAGDADDSGDRLLKEVYSDAVECSCVHMACSILAEDSYLTLIKVFADWLHSYSIVLAATSKQVSMEIRFKTHVYSDNLFF